MSMNGGGIGRRTLLALGVVVWISVVTEMLPRPVVAATVQGAAAEQVQPKESKNKLVWFFETIGVIGYGLIALSGYFVATVGKLFFELRAQVAIPPHIISQSEDLLQKREFMGIYNLLKADSSFFSRVLTTGITELPNGLSEAREAMEGVGEAVTVNMEKKISMLAVLGTLGPMIGLLGTLKGMIASFSVIALNDQQLKASEVAKGISEALLLTLLGVGLSVPAIYFFSLFKNRVSAISVDTMLRADEFLRHFAHATRKKTGPAGATAPATA